MNRDATGAAIRRRVCGAAAADLGAAYVADSTRERNG